MPDLRSLLKATRFADLFNALGGDHHARRSNFPSPRLTVRCVNCFPNFGLFE